MVLNYSVFKMKSCSWIGIFSVSFLMTSSVLASPVFDVEPLTINASVPIVNECNGVPALFKKNWHYRNIFNVVITKDAEVEFKLLNPESIGDGEFDMSCLQHWEDDDLVLTFSKEKSFYSYEVMRTTCVPTLGVLKLCNSAYVDPIVSLTVKEKAFVKPLPVIEFKSFETYSYNKADVENFLNEVEYYGFVKTPRAQVLITKEDASKLKINNTFTDGLKVMNDVIEKYFEYSGRSSIPIPNGPRINMALEKEVFLMKSEKCVRYIHNSSIENGRFIGNLKNHVDDYHVIRKTNCAFEGAYYVTKIVIFEDDISGFFISDVKADLLLHEIGHHFDIPQRDPYLNVYHVWNHLYVSFYQSRFAFKDSSDYWIQQEDGDSNTAEELYRKGALLQKYKDRQRTHFLMALFTLDNHDSSVFRSYNIRAMKDPSVKYNLLRSIAVFIKERYDVNVVPFIERAIDKAIPWLNVTNIYDLADSQNFRMPCFYFPGKKNYREYQYDEHNIKTTTNLRLCSTITRKPSKIKITVNNPELRNQTVKMNSMNKTVLKTPIEVDSHEKMFLFEGPINETAVVLPTYVFCGFEDNFYNCNATLNMLTYENPSHLLPPLIFNITGLNDELIALLQIDIRNNKMLVKPLVENGHDRFPRSEGAYVEIKLYNGSKSPVDTYKLNGTDMLIEDTQFNISSGYTIDLIAQEKNRVKIFDCDLNDLNDSEESNTTKFKIDEFGLTEMSTKPGKIRKCFAQILANDLKYKPYLNDYQYLKDLLTFLEKEN